MYAEGWGEVSQKTIGRHSLGRKELEAFVIYSTKNTFSYHADFFFLFFSWCEYFPRIVLVALMKSIPESVLQQQPTNYSPRAKWGPPSISMYLALKQRIVFRFLKVGEKKNVNRDSLWPAKPKIFTLDPLQKKFADPWCTEWMSVNVCVLEKSKRKKKRKERPCYTGTKEHTTPDPLVSRPSGSSGQGAAS